MRRTKIGGDRPGQINKRLERWLRWIRRVSILGMVVIVGLIVRWYDFEKLADAQWRALRGEVRQGAFLIFQDVDEDTVLGKGSLVEAHVELPPKLASLYKRDEGPILTIVKGTAGDIITFEPLGGQRVELRLNGKPITEMEAWWQEDVAAELRVEDGLVIPVGHFLLINPAVEVELDSRQVGLIPRSALRRKASYL